jgi:hypothetical protein
MMSNPPKVIQDNSNNIVSHLTFLLGIRAFMFIVGDGDTLRQRKADVGACSKDGVTVFCSLYCNIMGLFLRECIFDVARCRCNIYSSSNAFTIRRPHTA